MDWAGKPDDGDRIDIGEMPYWKEAVAAIYLVTMGVVMLNGITQFLRPIISLFGKH